ncbi:MAG: methylated-DNA--[protein]-cysteine S-methyltransferase [Ruminococcaceae bacterium]|nr:methylated-DNA--[protein]-cysteine S-methyltransferase [Oscillospiraceae bacterium]
MHYITTYSSPTGPLTLICDDRYLRVLHFRGEETVWRPDRERLVPMASHPVLQLTAHWLDRYFSGERPKPEELPLKPEGSPFQKQVWQFLLEIPWGETRTYGDLARRFPGTMSAQAVGQAVGRNPIALVIPCHRVLGEKGRLTGFSAGLEIKRWLLNYEGIAFRE